MTNSQKDKLFVYLDKNFDKMLSKNELKTLFRQLFYSTKLDKSYVNKTTERLLFNALNLESEDIQLSENEFHQLWTDWIRTILRPRSALIIVDVQNDFIDKNGSLYVPDGEKIVPVINQLIQTVNFDTIVYTYDWHLYNHSSFVESARDNTINRKIIKIKENVKTINDLKIGNTVTYKKYPNIPQKLWPRHCVQNTVGARLYKQLLLAKNLVKIFKGTNPDIDSYSAFKDNGGRLSTPLDKMLRQKGISYSNIQSFLGITDVYLSGVLYEFCVGRTAIDALKLGYRTGFIEDAIKAIDMEAKNQMRQKLVQMNAVMINSHNVLDLVNGRDRTVQMGLVLAEKLYQTDK